MSSGSYGTISGARIAAPATSTRKSRLATAAGEASSKRGQARRRSDW
jgi:hypothetical protein